FLPASSDIASAVDDAAPATSEEMAAAMASIALDCGPSKPRRSAAPIVARVPALNWQEVGAPGERLRRRQGRVLSTMCFDRTICPRPSGQGNCIVGLVFSEAGQRGRTDERPSVGSLPWKEGRSHLR